jgi:hypothetical protein
MDEIVEKSKPSWPMGKIYDIIHIYSGIKHGWETPELL